MKEVYFVGTEVKTPPLSSQARREIGLLLRLLQMGELLSLPRSRPMPTIANGCHELRINDKNSTWHVVYFLDESAIVILEVFSKKTNKTPQQTIKLCQRRLRLYQQHKKG